MNNLVVGETGNELSMNTVYRQGLYHVILRSGSPLTSDTAMSVSSIPTKDVHNKSFTFNGRNVSKRFIVNIS